MFNAQLIDELNIEKDRLNLFLNDFLRLFRSGDITTRDELLIKWNELIVKFNGSIGKVLFKPDSVLPDTFPWVQDHEDIFNTLYFDITTLFLKVQYIGRLIEGTVNKAILESDELIGCLKRIAAKVDDFYLYNGDGSHIVSESFINTDQIDLNSSKLQHPQALPLFESGSLVLAEKSKAQVVLKEVKVDFTNGVLGNNHDKTTNTLNNHVESLLDSRPDTWVEFERVFGLNNTIDTLNVNLTFTFDKTIVNRLVVEPILFGNLDAIDIDDILINSVSVKSHVPIAKYLNEADSDVFNLNATSSLYTGKLILDFLPSDANTLTIKFKSNTSFLVTGRDGVMRQRVAIGIKNIELFSVKYEDTSELLSKTIPGPWQKALLLTTQRPVNSSLSSIKYYVKVNNEWVRIEPAIESSFTIAEVLTGNGSDFLWRILLERNNEAFKNASTLSDVSNTKTIIESTILDTSLNPAKLTFTEKIENASQPLVYETIGCVGDLGSNRKRWLLGTGTGNSVKINLPFSITDSLRVYVNGLFWSEVDDLGMWRNSNVWLRDGNSIVFGLNGLGNVPRTGETIEIGFVPERLFFKKNGEQYEALLDFNSDVDKGFVSLERLASPSSQISYVLPKGQTSIQLKHRNIFNDNVFGRIQIQERAPDGTLITSGAYQNLRVFLHEVVADGDYSIDSLNGKLISYTPSSTSNTTIISYRQLPEVAITNYEITPEKVALDASQIVLNTHVDTTGEDRVFYDWQGYHVPPNETLVSDEASDTKVINLSHDMVVNGSLKLPQALFPSEKLHEVEFHDGNTELWQGVQVLEEPIPAYGGTGLNTYFLNHTNLLQHTGIIFSDTTSYATETTPASAPGDYNVNWTTGEVNVFLGSVPSDPGTVSYFYNDPSINVDGYYSVDYKHGKIYCTETPVDGNNIQYSYTNYRIHYPIIRLLTSDEYSVDYEKNQLTINTGQLLSGKLKYKYNYVAELSGNLTDLIEYYTPLIRDVRFRLL